VSARRGRLHAYTYIDPAKTALVVVDLDVGTVRRMHGEQGVSEVLEHTNTLAKKVRELGGTVAWVVSPMDNPGAHFRELYGSQTAAMYDAEAQSGKSVTIANELDHRPTDVRAYKQGYSAFFPGKSDLHEQLQSRGIDTVLIVGTVTNVCCESSARDAYELDYKVIMVSDALKGHANGLHEASLATIFRNFGDVRPSEEVVRMLSE
jgi:ureidoacrylate peracid hydrolase